MQGAPPFPSPPAPLSLSLNFRLVLMHSPKIVKSAAVNTVFYPPLAFALVSPTSSDGIKHVMVIKAWAFGCRGRTGVVEVNVWLTVP